MRLHHNWSHHFVIFVGENVAVVHKPWELNKLIFWYCEECLARIILSLSKLLIAHMGFGPADSHHDNMSRSNPSSFFISLPKLRDLISNIVTDIFKDTFTSTCRCGVVAIIDATTSRRTPFQHIDS